MIPKRQSPGVTAAPEGAGHFKRSDRCGKHIRILSDDGSYVCGAIFLDEQWDESRGVPEQQSVVLFPIPKKLIEHAGPFSRQRPREEILRKRLTTSETNQTLRGKLLDARFELALIDRYQRSHAFHESECNPG